MYIEIGNMIVPYMSCLSFSNISQACRTVDLETLGANRFSPSPLAKVQSTLYIEDNLHDHNICS